jgi:hypothetical protein
MRRALALAAFVTPILVIGAAAGAAQAEKWTKYVDADNGAAWSYDADYTYKDGQTGRIVVMQAISKGTLGPGAPGKADGVGSVVALDCAKKNLILLSGYSPSKPLDIKSSWRAETPKKAEGHENEALIAAVCPSMGAVPVK